MSKLTSFDLHCSLIEFLQFFWHDWDYHEEFVKKTVHEEVINKEDWSISNDTNEIVVDDIKVLSFKRIFTSKHPLPVSLPWLPIHVTNQLIQTIKITYCNNNSKLHEKFVKAEIFEMSTVSGIPLIEPKVCVHWILKEYVNDFDQDMLNIKMDLSFEEASSFNIITPLVISHSRAELSTYYRYWRESAQDYITDHENDNIFTDSHVTIKDNNTISKIHQTEDNKLKDLYKIIKEIQLVSRKQFRKLIIDKTDSNPSQVFLCVSSNDENEKRESDGFFSVFNNIFCSSSTL